MEGALVRVNILGGSFYESLGHVSENTYKDYI